jgi:hypothetical protein
VPTVRGAEGVRVKVVLVASAVMGPVTAGETVNVEALIVAGFMALLKVAVMSVVGQGVVEARAGRTVETLGALSGEVGLNEPLSGSPQPRREKAKIDDKMPSLEILKVCMGFASEAGDEAEESPATIVKFGISYFLR